MRSEPAAAIEAARGDDGIRAVVLAGAGKLFTGGADVREFGKPRQPSSPAASVQRLGRY